MNPLQPAPHLRVAVSIATRDRCSEVETTCRVLAELNPAPDEVWLVADGCSDGTAAFVRGRFPWIHVIEHATSQGHVRSRDEVMRRTDCDIVLLLDDDSHPIESDFILRLRELFAWRPRMAVASIPQKSDEFPQTLVQEDFGPPVFAGSYSNASAALRRSAYIEIGGYDLDFFHAYDEVDFSLRALAAGYEIYRPAHMAIRHRFSRLNRDEVRMHHLHSCYEQASVWRRCPMPYALPVSLFRALRQAQYAFSRGWLLREPKWWWTAAWQFAGNLKRRKPVSWAAYCGWMRLLRFPAASEEQWNRTRESMKIKSGQVGDLDLPRISIAATNPCHLYSMARALACNGALESYYSGYPRWKLPGSHASWVRTHSLRTLAVYGALKFLPPHRRPASEELFRWQDDSFDRWVSHRVRMTDFIHAMPGQCLHTFRRARELGIRTVLNHATGPIENTIRVLKAEYERAGLEMPELAAANEAALKNRREEMTLADFHCVASTLVRDQLIHTCGVDPEKIWVIPYGADQDIFYPRRGDGPKEFRIVYAGQYVVRKGLRFLFEALEQVAEENWSLDCYGPRPDVAAQMIPDQGRFKLRCPVRTHGAVPAAQLAQVFRESSVLVLPSLEEGFGLVVVQALNCGIPCIVSDSVGAKDLIVPDENGSIFPAGNAKALADYLVRWKFQRRTLHALYPWEYPARKLIETSRSNWNA